MTEKIERLRQKMIEDGMKKGLQNKETLGHSQELDELIYKIQLKARVG
ncbi:aspartyl-phosphate phosphatase Spo0E family protein [Heyndrickxia sp. NPDC080065]